MKATKTIIITGTHHTPAIELIRLLQTDPDRKWKIYYLGHQYKTETHLVHTIIPKLKIDFFQIDCGKYDRKNLDKTIFGFYKTIKAFFTSLKLISSLKPDIVVSFGGYVSVPVIIASYFKKIPSITHEQTTTISLSTKINSFFVNKVAVSFPHEKYIYTGNLIRREIFNTKSTKFSHINKPFLYFTGGNQGSIFLNNLVYQLVDKLSPKFSIIHQTGKNNNSQIESDLVKKYPSYHPTEFIDNDDIGYVLNKSSIIVSRSGANICQEIDVLDQKSILIPHPFTQQNEQQKNAQWLKTRHPQNTIVINQDKVSLQLLLSSVNSLSAISYRPTPQKISAVHPLFTLINEIIN